MTTSLLRRTLRLESLETRRVLDASLFEGLLTVEGTNRNDRIWVGVAGDLHDQVHVQINKSSWTFVLSEVQEMHIFAGAGNDRVWIGADVLINALIDGGRGNDWLHGGGGSDSIVGGLGNDHATGGAGDDALDGGAGHDWLHGGAGNDSLEGGAGADHLGGGEGNDHVSGGDGHDHLRGGAGNDELFGGNGHDLLGGGEGDDLVHGDAGRDHLHGGAGNDELFGDAGADQIWGGDGDDWVEGGDGNDHLRGNMGNDSLKGGLGDDFLNGGWGENLLDGDEGTNTLKNGTEVDFDQPPPPPADEEYTTYLTGEGGNSATLVYTKTWNGTAFEEVLDISIDNHFACTAEIRIGGVLLGSVLVDDTGHAQIKFSTIADQPDELPFPDGFTLSHGLEVLVGPEMHGPLILQD